MKITITDNDKSVTVIFENIDNTTLSKAQHILDVLCSVEPNRAARRLSVPADPEQFDMWLNSSSSPIETAKAISDMVGSDITMYSSAHALIIGVPRFAQLLGYTRYYMASKWLHEQGWIYELPSESSMRTYYRKALRNLNA